MMNTCAKHSVGRTRFLLGFIGFLCIFVVAEAKEADWITVRRDVNRRLCVSFY